MGQAAGTAGRRSAVAVSAALTSLTKMAGEDWRNSCSFIRLKVGAVDRLAGIVTPGQPHQAALS